MTPSRRAAETVKRGERQMFGEAAAWPDMKLWRREVARRLWLARKNMRTTYRPLRLMTEGSATVVYDDDLPGSSPFATFSLDSRAKDFYAVALRAAEAVVRASNRKADQ